jgi:EAL domain-containing protein (putative c-di-GMP-specific phosphodiesterase class I)
MRKFGCDQLQGFLFGHPVPATTLAKTKLQRRA